MEQNIQNKLAYLIQKFKRFYEKRPRLTGFFFVFAIGVTIAMLVYTQGRKDSHGTADQLPDKLEALPKIIDSVEPLSSPAEQINSSLSHIEKRKLNTVEQPSCVYVDISGAVKSPGVYCTKGGDRLNDLVKMAGGFEVESYAARYVDHKFNLSRTLKSAEKVYIPFENEVVCRQKGVELDEDVDGVTVAYAEKDGGGDETYYEQVEDGGESGSGSGDDEGDSEEESNDSDEDDCVNLNTATIAELDELDGVGPSTAQKIVDARPFAAVEELDDVSGIGDATYAKIKPHVCI